MSTTPVSQPSSSTPTTPTAASNPAAAAAGGASNVQMTTSISSMNQLQNSNPALYYQVMVGVASNMITEMKRKQDEVIANMKKTREDLEGSG